MTHMSTLSESGPHFVAVFAFLFAGLMMSANRRRMRTRAALRATRPAEYQRSAYNARSAARDEVDAELPNVGRDDRELLALVRAAGVNSKSVR
jgi:hypothetical protein